MVKPYFFLVLFFLLTCSLKADDARYVVVDFEKECNQIAVLVVDTKTNKYQCYLSKLRAAWIYPKIIVTELMSKGYKVDYKAFSYIWFGQYVSEEDYGFD